MPHFKDACSKTTAEVKGYMVNYTLKKTKKNKKRDLSVSLFAINHARKEANGVQRHKVITVD